MLLTCMNCSRDSEEVDIEVFHYPEENFTEVLCKDGQGCLDYMTLSNCSCDNEESTFFQNHGSCEWCYFVGDDVLEEDC